MRFLLTSIALASVLCAGALPSQARPVEKMNVQDISSYVDFVTVLPGERFPLRVTDSHGRPVPAVWRATGGAIAYGNKLAVWQAPLQPGAHRVTGTALVDGHQVSRSLSMVVTVPAVRARGGKLNGYPIGTYPHGLEEGEAMLANRGVRKNYDVPLGFIELTASNLDVPVSRHYKLRDFAGKDSFVNGRKYMFVQPKMVEKLERIIDTINAEGYRSGKIELMSAYRSPYLNASIGNDTTLSRHTYGDAADMLAADFNGDGRVDRTDGQILFGAADKLDRTTSLTGGGSLYNPNGAHGYFVHTDTRGFIARW